MPHCFRFTRREALRIGGLSLFAPPTASLARAASRSAVPRSLPERAGIFVFLQGGPSHIDLWDPKPDAPREVRGAFSTISTTVPGTHLTELLPLLGQHAQQFSLIRSMTHEFNNHIAGAYVMQTGDTNQPNADREAAHDDFPGPGAVLSAVQDSSSAIPVSVSLPNWLSIPGPSTRMPGQYGGFLGATNDPFLLEGDPNAEEFAPLNLSLRDDVAGRRLDRRRGLLSQLESQFEQRESRGEQSWNQMRETALGLLSDRRVRDALDLSREKDTVRDRYGRTKLGQSLLLARRLIEAGVRFISVNEFNQTWDHHFNVEPSLKALAPEMDRAVSALLDDLDDRGLLESTFTAVTGEFGRAPRVNSDRGRDHWSRAYSTLVAGGGIRGGHVVGRSDAQGGYVADRPVRPDDFLATMWQSLGIDPQRVLHDRLGRPRALTNGIPVAELL